MTTHSTTEAEKMARVPGITFVDGPAGRRAHVDGGLDVFEVIKIYRACGQRFDELKLLLSWHTDDQLRAALAYYGLYPDEIDERLRIEDGITPETLYAQYPYMKPGQ